MPTMKLDGGAITMNRRRPAALVSTPPLSRLVVAALALPTLALTRVALAAPSELDAGASTATATVAVGNVGNSERIGAAAKEEPRAPDAPRTPRSSADAMPDELRTASRARVRLLFLDLTGDRPLPPEIENPASLPGASVVSAPTVSTIDGRRVEAALGHDYTFTNAAGAEETCVLGTNIIVLPRIHRDVAELEIESTYAELAGFSEESGRKVPIISSRSLKTRVTVQRDSRRWTVLTGLVHPSPPAKRSLVLLKLETEPAANLPSGATPSAPTPLPAPTLITPPAPAGS